MSAAVNNFKLITRKAEIRYQQLPNNRRHIVNVAIALLVITGIYAGLLRPAMQFRLDAQAKLEQEQALLSYVTQHADRIRQINAARQMKTGSDTSLLALASNTASEFGLTIQRSQPNTDGKLSVWLSQADFNQLLTWLDQLTTQYNIQIERFNISQTGKPAVVEAQVILK